MPFGGFLLEMEWLGLDEARNVQAIWDMILNSSGKLAFNLRTIKWIKVTYAI